MGVRVPTSYVCIWTSIRVPALESMVTPPAEMLKFAAGCRQNSKKLSVALVAVGAAGEAHRSLAAVRAVELVLKLGNEVASVKNLDGVEKILAGVGQLPPRQTI